MILPPRSLLGLFSRLSATQWETQLSVLYGWGWCWFTCFFHRVLGCFLSPCLFVCFVKRLLYFDAVECESNMLCCPKRLLLNSMNGKPGVIAKLEAFPPFFPLHKRNKHVFNVRIVWVASKIHLSSLNHSLHIVSLWHQRVCCVWPVGIGLYWRNYGLCSLLEITS